MACADNHSGSGAARGLLAAAVIAAVVAASAAVAAEKPHIPTGEPGDPFRITEIQGDGWRMLELYPEFSAIWFDHVAEYSPGHGWREDVGIAASAMPSRL